MYVTILPLLLCIVNFKMINFSDTIHEGIQLLREYLSSQNQVDFLNPGLKQRRHLIHLDNSLIQKSQHLIENNQVTLTGRKYFSCKIHAVADIHPFFLLLLLR